MSSFSAHLIFFVPHVKIYSAARACVVANDKLYVIGGQEGDFMAKPGSPIFKCSRRHEVFILTTFVLKCSHYAN